ncbi:PREDICTED: collagen alpha-1(III) chain-like, partial [Chinchilla lanigera]|uniref:collagen alpha-1(III) chain-like n=1 Tax=Chinchilla lanigera TaxID=34839 RepID=UPI00069723DE
RARPRPGSLGLGFPGAPPWTPGSPPRDAGRPRHSRSRRPGGVLGAGTRGARGPRTPVGASRPGHRQGPCSSPREVAGGRVSRGAAARAGCGVFPRLSGTPLGFRGAPKDFPQRRLPAAASPAHFAPVPARGTLVPCTLRGAPPGTGLQVWGESSFHKTRIPCCLGFVPSIPSVRPQLGCSADPRSGQSPSGPRGPQHPARCSWRTEWVHRAGTILIPHRQAVQTPDPAAQPNRSQNRVY